MQIERLRQEISEASSTLAVEERIRRDVAVALVHGGPSVALARLPERAIVREAALDVQEAADAGDTDTALKRLRLYLLRKEQHQAAASTETDRQLQQSVGTKLLDAGMLAEMEALAQQVEPPAPEIPQLPRAERRALVRAQRKRNTKRGKRNTGTLK